MKPLIVSAFSAVGKVRHHNEDSYFLPIDTKKQFFVVADGVGGSPSGELASITAANTAMVSAMTTKHTDIEKITDEAFRKASEAMVQYSKGMHSGMGTTMATLAIARRRDHAIIGNVGDSRVYLFHDDRLTQITKDQSYRGCLLGVISTHMSTKPSLYDIKVSPGDIFLLCTDGVTNELSDQLLATMLRQRKSAEDIVNKVLSSTRAKDNATVIVVEVP